MRGNRRSVNNPEGEGSAAGDVTVRIAPAEPQISSKGLQFSGFSPIKPLPSIKETVAQTLSVVQHAQNVASSSTSTANPEAPVEPPVAGSDAPAEEPSHPEGEPAASPMQETEPSDSPQTPEETPPETFEECWYGMVDAIFQKKPAFYHQLRDYLPRYEDEVIYVDVENDFQKNQLEMSKRAMLEFWRAHYKLNVNEMEFVIHEHERKKVIYTSEDKVNNMLEQNPELKNFLQVLNFRIKD